MSFLDYSFHLVTIVWGLITIIGTVARYYKPTPFSTWSQRRVFFMIVPGFWGIGFILLGSIKFFPTIHQVAYVLFGMSTLFMIFIPCSDRSYNTNYVKRMLRTATLGTLGALYILFA